MSKKINIQELKNKIITIQNELNHVLLELDVALGLKSSDAAAKARAEGEVVKMGETRIVEGVFDGQGMVGPDGKQYPVPANYASKSKLIEGDMLKLTIQGDGTFLFKQIGPIERDRLVGVVAFDDNEKQFFGVANGKSYMLLTAAVTYYKGEVGDEVIMLVPQKGTSVWAAVENVVKQLAVSEEVQKKKKGDEKNIEEDDEFKLE
ncbi:MAG: hypothetical protein GY793_08255 [Proteobacteria bacterium]|nr:hypothetical protein [Pseudomonadota bacterium]